MTLMTKRETMQTNSASRTKRAGILGGAAIVAALLGAGCDVTNPGPVQDEFLGDEAAQPGLINGAQRILANGFRQHAFDVAILSREMFPGGQTGAWGTNVYIHGGEVLEASGRGNFTNMHEARFVTKTAIQRFAEVGASDSRMHQAHFWAGITFRILGEGWCNTVLPATDPLDDSPGEYFAGTTEPYFERALANYTSALEFATTDEQRHAAHAGRANIHLWMGNWQEALDDARQVPDDFQVVLGFTGEESALYNYISEAHSGTFRSASQRFTWFEGYYDETGDPRTPWGIDPDFDVAVGSLTGFPGGRVPYAPQQKYAERDDAMNLHTGWEMRLVEAEAILQGAGGGDFNEAMALINHVRTRNVSDHDGQPLEPWEANSAEEAWTFLKRERGIELWLEGRRLFDERRWNELGTPGELDLPEWEDPNHPGHAGVFVDHTRSFCFDIPQSERDRNPNVPVTGN